MNSPKNTTREYKNVLGLTLSIIMTAGNNNLILQQEAEGQRSFVDSDTLPVVFLQPEGKSILESLGVEFLGAVKDDPIFQFVKLPDGWKKVAAEHSLWTDLIDENGRKRAAIFYKATFYDRSAHICLLSRYSIDYSLFGHDPGILRAMDGETEIFRSHVSSYSEANKCVRDWLDKMHPNWEREY